VNVLVVGPAGRAETIAGELARRGARVRTVRTGAGRRALAPALVRALRLARCEPPDAIVTVSGAAPTELIGRVVAGRRVRWVAHVEAAPALPDGRWGRMLHPRARALRRADVVTADPAAVDAMHLAARVAVAGTDPAAAALASHAAPALGRTLLMLGTLNSPHVEHLATAMRDRGYRVVVAGDVSPAYPPSALPDAGVEVRPLEVPMMLWLRRLWREERPDVVHANWMPSYAFLAALLRLRPLVAMAWGSDVLGVLGSSERRVRFAVRRADVAMSDSEAVRRRLVELGADSAATFVINWGVELAQFAPATDRVAVRRALGLGGGPVVLSPRALRPLYNPRVIIDAFSDATADRPDVQLVLKHLEAVAPDLPLPASARIIGHVPYEQLPAFYRAADICISIPDSDSSPRSVWEAMACGCACVVSDLPWARELIVDDKHALLVAPERAAVAAALRRLLEEPGLAARLGANARSLVEAHRDVRWEMDRLAELYASLAR
jgi:glycosyltransferase involved in cell wall biosynthesis